MSLVFENKIPGDKLSFIAKLKEVCARLGINPNWLMAVINKESAGTFSPSVLNTAHPFADGFATGLIQFIPSTARGLGTTTEALARMTAVQQLEYVYKYFSAYKGKIKSYSDLYLVTFYPYALGKPQDYVFGSERSQQRALAVAGSNKGIDLNKDGLITKKEFEAYVYKGFSDEVVKALMEKKKE